MEINNLVRIEGIGIVRLLDVGGDDVFTHAGLGHAEDFGGHRRQIDLSRSDSFRGSHICTRCLRPAGVNAYCYKQPKGGQPDQGHFVPASHLHTASGFFWLSKSMTNIAYNIKMNTLLMNHDSSVILPSDTVLFDGQMNVQIRN